MAAFTIIVLSSPALSKHKIIFYCKKNFIILEQSQLKFLISSEILALFKV